MESPSHFSLSSLSPPSPQAAGKVAHRRKSRCATSWRPRCYLLALVLFIPISMMSAAVGLTTVPEREQVRLTIYNSVDLTLAQERRDLVLKPGINYVQYQWANTLIDTTSIELMPLERHDDIEIIDMIYPPGAPATLIWRVQSDVEGVVPFEISYFTSGLSWNADYVLRADPREETAEIEGHVAVINNSGETYHNAEVRLVVGSINLVEKIRDLATGQISDRRRDVSRQVLGRSKSAFRNELSVNAPAAMLSEIAAIDEVAI